jgi:ABC-type multidrug transport system fused ATPase/permease subunit
VVNKKPKTFLQKLKYLLSKNQKRQLAVLAVLLLIGMFFEMAGLGVLVPSIGVMLNPDVGNKYPALKPFLNALGNPSQSRLIVLGLTIMVSVYFVKTIFLAFLGWKQSKFSAELTADLSHNLFSGYLKQPYAFHLQRNSAELLRNTQNEINQFASVSQSAITLTVELSLLVSVAFMLILVEPIGALIVTGFLGISSFIFHRLTRNKLLNWGESRQFIEGKTNQHLLQGLGGVKDLKILGREDNFIHQFNVHNTNRAKITTKQYTLLQIPRLYLEFLAVLGMAGLIMVMVWQQKPLDLILPTLGIFVAAAFRMIPSVNRIMGSMQAIRYSRPVVNILYDEFYLIRNTKEATPSLNRLAFKNELVVNNLNFSYPNVTAKALENVMVTIKKGESVGFVGSSGSGKSTLVDNILGLLTPDSGNISLDGVDIEHNLREWQNQIGYVPQSIYLTDDSLLHNVAFGISPEDIDMNDVQQAIKAAQLDEFIEGLPEGIHTMVGERGVRLSGGQRQRIGIARALYHDPHVLVLDEATSSLDSDTEQAVMDAVNLLHGEKTILIVAHRLTTLKNCDRIYKLEKGKLVESDIKKK